MQREVGGVKSHRVLSVVILLCVSSQLILSFCCHLFIILLNKREFRFVSSARETEFLFVNTTVFWGTCVGGCLSFDRGM